MTERDDMRLGASITHRQPVRYPIDIVSVIIERRGPFFKLVLVKADEEGIFEYKAVFHAGMLRIIHACAGKMRGYRFAPSLETTCIRVALEFVITWHHINWDAGVIYHRHRAEPCRILRIETG